MTRQIKLGPFIFWSAKEASQYLGYSPSTMRRWEAGGTISAGRLFKRPYRHQKHERQVTYNGETYPTLRAAARAEGISAGAMWYRLENENG